MMNSKAKKKWAWSWGKGIFLVYGLFVCGILFMVTAAVRQKIDLVAPDYYARELVYQQQIDKMKRSNALPEPLTIKVEKDNIVLHFPFSGDSVSGMVDLFRPSDALHDRKIEILAGVDGKMYIPVQDLHPGAYRIKVDWMCQGISYFDEQVLVIQSVH